MDDWGYITQNPWVTGAESPLRFWTTFQQTDYWPLSYTFYWLFYQLFGEDPTGYHAVNVLVHSLNALLLLVFAKHLQIRWAVWAALLFLVHPLHVQATAWIIQFKTLLSTALALGCLIFFLRYLNGLGKRWFMGSLVIFVLALLAKTSVMFLPFVLLLMGYMHKSRNWIPVVAFFVMSLIGGCITLWVNELNFHDRQADVFQMAWLDRPLLMVQNLCFYLRSFFLPFGLGYLYPFKVPTWESVSWLKLAGFVFILTAMFYLLIARASARRRTYFLSYLTLLLPALGLVAIPNMKLSLVAEHWAYLPDTYMALLVAEIIPSRLKWRSILILPLIVLSALTYQHAHTFATEEAFWLRALRQNPESPIAMYNLGTVYGKKNRVAESIEIYRRTVQADPSHHRAWYNLGRAYSIERQFEKAEECFLQALKLNPQLVNGYIALSKVYISVGSRDLALRVLRQGLAFNPGNVELAAPIKELSR